MKKRTVTPNWQQLAVPVAEAHHKRRTPMVTTRPAPRQARTKCEGASAKALSIFTEEDATVGRRFPTCGTGWPTQAEGGGGNP